MLPFNRMYSQIQSYKVRMISHSFSLLNTFSHFLINCKIPLLSSLKGLSLYTSYMSYSLNNTNYISNSFLLNSISSYVVIFDGKLSAYLTTTSSFLLSNSTISSNTEQTCSYTLYLASNCPVTVIDTTSEIVTVESYYLFQIDYVTKATLYNVTSMDNIMTLIYFVHTLTFHINTLTCANTAASTSVLDQCCIYMSDFKKLNFTMTNSIFYNKYLSNTYLIEGTSSEYSLGTSSYDGNFTIYNTTFSGINLATQNAFYMSSQIYMNSLQVLLINITNSTFSYVSYSTPQRLFYS